MRYLHKFIFQIYFFKLKSVVKDAIFKMNDFLWNV